MTDSERNKLEERLGYHFMDKTLLMRALTHSSYMNEQKNNKLQDYERLEFLGDAVLEMVSSAFLYSRYPERSEGELSKTRASLVCEQALSGVARSLGLSDYLILGHGEDMGGGRNKPSILCDVTEALIGAMYLDSGEDVNVPKQFIIREILSDIEDKQLFYDAKSILQEYVAKDGKVLSYRLISEDGPSHERVYHMEVLIGEQPVADGTGHSKKAAEQEAAYEALKKTYLR